MFDRKISVVGIRLSRVGIILIVIFVLVTLLHRPKRRSYHEPDRPMVSMHALLVAGIEISEKGGRQVKFVHDFENTDRNSNESLKLAFLANRLSQKAMMEAFQVTFPLINVVEQHKVPNITLQDVKPAPTYNEEVSKLIGHQDELVDVNDITAWIEPLNPFTIHTGPFNDSNYRFMGLETQLIVTTMVCVAVRGKPTIGIIHRPFERETYWSWVGHGSNIKDKSNPDSKHSIMVSEGNVMELRTITKSSIIPISGKGYPFLALVKGDQILYVDLAFNTRSSICSGHAILNHAGGKMTDKEGSEIEYFEQKEPIDGVMAAIRNHDYYYRSLAYEF